MYEKEKTELKEKIKQKSVKFINNPDLITTEEVFRLIDSIPVTINKEDIVKKLDDIMEHVDCLMDTGLTGVKSLIYNEHSIIKHKIEQIKGELQ